MKLLQAWCQPCGSTLLTYTLLYNSMIMPTNYTNLYNDYAYKLLDNQFLDKQHSEIFNIFNLLAAMQQLVRIIQSIYYITCT